MRTRSLLAWLLGVSLLLIGDLYAADATSSLSGGLVGTYFYESHNGGSYEVIIEVSISREGKRYVLGFQGAHPEAKGAAPEGGGTGKIGADGVLRFPYEDSFSNRGTGSFRRTRHGYRLIIDITHLREPRCDMFYGDWPMRRTSVRPRW